MSHHLLAGEVTAVDDAPGTAQRLRRLYLVRCAFAIAWAVSFALSASSLTAVSVTLLVLYPLVDAAAVLADRRSSGAADSRWPLGLNVALSLLAALSLALAAGSGASWVLGVWGAWAIAAGVVQLVVAIRRRALGGQWSLVLSGAISTVAGAGFVVSSARTEPSLTGLAGYALLGGVFFLVAALRLPRAA